MQKFSEDFGNSRTSVILSEQFQKNIYIGIFSPAVDYSRSILLKWRYTTYIFECLSKHSHKKSDMEFSRVLGDWLHSYVLIKKWFYRRHNSRNSARLNKLNRVGMKCRFDGNASELSFTFFKAGGSFSLVWG